MPRLKFTPEKKVEIIEAYRAGNVSKAQLRDIYGMNPNEITNWMARYDAHGIDAFKRGVGNAQYSQEFKLRCVEEYLAGQGSLCELAAKYKIPGKETLRTWVKRYQADLKLREYNPKREMHLETRKEGFTREQRDEIAAYCIAHGSDYRGTAALYNVPYTQVYFWVRRRRPK